MGFAVYSSILLALSLSLLLIIQTTAAAAAVLSNLSTLSFDEGYLQLFGDSNLILVGDGKTVHITLDERTGAGFASQDLYLHGRFSASIKLPSYYAAGVVVAFYMSNGDIYEKTHDELDFEFLGNVRGREWKVQTNVYANGSTAVGREERYTLSFDPTLDFHHYSILWTHHRIIFYIDGLPIREVLREDDSSGSNFPLKPMSLYATIWDGSNWATAGGRYKVNYRYAPFVAEFADLSLRGCAVDPTDRDSACDGRGDAYDAVVVSADQRRTMEGFRKRHMVYSYCHDRARYPNWPSECSAASAGGFRWSGGGARLRGRRWHRRAHRRSPMSANC